jgi:transcription regulator of multidrug-efflux transporter
MSRENTGLEKFFSISKTAEQTHMTAETLRHYDRIGLVRPARTDEWTGYRYYSEREIVMLNTVHALKCMDMPLAEIKRILECGDISKIVYYLQCAKSRAEEKIADLNGVRCRIDRAMDFYNKKSGDKPAFEEEFVRELPERAILLSENLSIPSVDNLWNYHRHYYAQLDDSEKAAFEFEDAAGVYDSDGSQRMFVVCSRYVDNERLIKLPAGRYLCAYCKEENRSVVSARLISAASDRGSAPRFSLHMVVLSGILQWTYQIQVFIGS